MRRALLACAAAALAAAALAAAGCGGSGADRVGTGGKLSQAPHATCSQWHGASFGDRMSVVRQLGIVFARDTFPGEDGRRLGDREAYEVLEQACAPAHARNFKLYKLYSRALAFGR